MNRSKINKSFIPAGKVLALSFSIFAAYLPISGRSGRRDLPYTPVFGQFRYAELEALAFAEVP